MFSKKALIGGVLLVLVAFAGLQLAIYVTREGSLLEQTTISTAKSTKPVFLKAEEDVALKKQEPGNAQGSTVNTSDWTTKSNEHFKVSLPQGFLFISESGESGTSGEICELFEDLDPSFLNSVIETQGEFETFNDNDNVARKGYCLLQFESSNNATLIYDSRKKALNITEENRNYEERVLGKNKAFITSIQVAPLQTFHDYLIRDSAETNFVEFVSRPVSAESDTLAEQIISTVEFLK